MTQFKAQHEQLLSEEEERLVLSHLRRGTNEQRAQQIKSLEAQITLAQFRIERIGEELDTLKRKRLECEDKIHYLSRLIEMAQTIEAKK